MIAKVVELINSSPDGVRPTVLVSATAVGYYGPFLSPKSCICFSWLLKTLMIHLCIFIHLCCLPLEASSSGWVGVGELCLSHKCILSKIKIKNSAVFFFCGGVDVLSAKYWDY